MRSARTGIDHVGHRFGLEQVELAVAHGALRELTGQRGARAGSEKGGHHRGAHVAPAVEAQFDDILARRGVRRGKECRERIIE